MTKGNPINLLLVEDDEAHAEIVRRCLAEARVANRMFHLRDGQSALDYLLRQGPYAPPAEAVRPDLILLDLRLPKVDGQQVLRRLKSDPDLCRIPVVILTTSKAELDIVAAYQTGAGSYLVKPVDYEKFTQLMETFGFYWLVWNQYPH
jgi:CheY-like chemotaxis protein